MGDKEPDDMTPDERVEEVLRCQAFVQENRQAAIDAQLAIITEAEGHLKSLGYVKGKKGRPVGSPTRNRKPKAGAPATA